MALAVVGVAVVAAVVSYEHASDLVRAHRESGWTGRLIPLTDPSAARTRAGTRPTLKSGEAD